MVSGCNQSENTRREPMNEAIRAEIEKLRGQKAKVLQVRYRELFG